MKGAGHAALAPHFIVLTETRVHFLSSIQIQSTQIALKSASNLVLNRSELYTGHFKKWMVNNHPQAKSINAGTTEKL